MAIPSVLSFGGADSGAGSASLCNNGNAKGPSREDAIGRLRCSARCARHSGGGASCLPAGAHAWRRDVSMEGAEAPEEAAVARDLQALG